MIQGLDVDVMEACFALVDKCIEVGWTVFERQWKRECVVATCKCFMVNREEKRCEELCAALLKKLLASSGSAAKETTQMVRTFKDPSKISEKP